MHDICLALCICTYNRQRQLEHNINKLKESFFFSNPIDNKYYGKLHIYVVDNASNVDELDLNNLHICHNPKGNVGGSGGFQYGIELVRLSGISYTHFIFMDDDVEFEIDSFYLLFDILLELGNEDVNRPIAGRMFCLDDKDIQYTAAEIWNKGEIKHVGFRKTVAAIENEPLINISSGAEYGGWWFCCYPWSFVKENDIIPFFIHCDDVEYGLRCGQPPIIVKGIHVWHEVADKRMTPIMAYYDTRNTLFVNDIHKLNIDANETYDRWFGKISLYHRNKDYASEYYSIIAMNDYMRGLKWLYKVDSAQLHSGLKKKMINKYKNMLLWRIVAFKYFIKFVIIKR